MTVTRRGFFGALAAVLAWRPWRATPPTVIVTYGDLHTSTYGPWQSLEFKGKPFVWDEAELEKAFTFAYDNCTRPGDPV